MENPSEEKPQDQTVFDRCVDRLVRTIAFEDAEKLSLLMRDTISWLLGTLKKHNNQPAMPVVEDRLSFKAQLLEPSATTFEMHFYGDEDMEKSGIPPIGLMRFKDGYYMGRPDNARTQSLEKLPPLVRRRLIYAINFRRNRSRRWSKIEPSNGISELRLDFQINVSESEKK